MSPLRIFSIQHLESVPKPNLRFLALVGGVNSDDGSPVLLTIIASCGISEGGRRLLKIVRIKFNQTKKKPCKGSPSFI